jgi:hypothetical protein
MQVLYLICVGAATGLTSVAVIRVWVRKRRDHKERARRERSERISRVLEDAQANRFQLPERSAHLKL